MRKAAYIAAFVLALPVLIAVDLCAAIFEALSGDADESEGRGHGKNFAPPSCGNSTGNSIDSLSVTTVSTANNEGS